MGITGYPVGNGQPSLPVTPLPLHIITSDQPLVLLPEETDLFVFPESTLVGKTAFPSSSSHEAVALVSER